jgi:DNA-damage-inducible protein J
MHKDIEYNKTKSDIISFRIEHNLKEETTQILDQLGLTIGQATTMFLKQVQIKHGLPFDVVLPNKQTLDAIQEVENLIKGKKKGKAYKSFNEMLSDSL